MRGCIAACFDKVVCAGYDFSAANNACTYRNFPRRRGSAGFIQRIKHIYC